MGSAIFGNRATVAAGPAGSWSPPADDTYDLGTSSLRWRDLYLSRNLLMGNAKYIKARNAANDADLSILKADASDNTFLNAKTAKVINFGINDSAVANFSASGFFPVTDNALDFGDLTHRFKDIHTSGNINLANATFLQARNAANDAYLSLLKADLSDNTVINAKTGKTVNINVNDSNIAKWSSTALNPASDATIDIGALATRFRDLYLSRNMVLANNNAILARDSGGSTNNTVLYSDGSNDTFLETKSARKILLKVSGAAGKVSWDDSNGTFDIINSSGSQACTVQANQGSHVLMFSAFNSGTKGRIGMQTNHELGFFSNNTERFQLTAAGALSQNSSNGGLLIFNRANTTINFAGTMGTSSKVVGTDAVSNWIEVQVGGNTRYIPSYAA